MALGITCVPLLAMSLAQLDWTHCVVVPVRRKAIAAGTSAKTSSVATRRRPNSELAETLARYLTTEFAG
jgi:hypothetical protein